MKRPTKIRVWGGFYEGRLHMDDHGYCRTVTLYRTRHQAQTDYEDVRRIEIREVPRHARAKGSAA